MIGTLTRNAAPHQKNSSTSPPSSGPIAAPTEKLVIHTAIAFVRCFGSTNMLRIKDSVDGAIVAPAIPSSALVPINISALVDRAASTEAAPNAAAPISRSRRRPIRSPSVPIVISDPATTNP
jgi:hypothetical protein